MEDREKGLRDAYDAIADVYESEVFPRPYQANWDKKIRSLLDKYVRPVDPLAEERAIDLGCGTGAYTSLLLARGYHVVGIDLSPKMAGITLEKGAQQRDRLEVLVADILDMDFPQGKFQLAIAFGSVLNHLEDWEAFFDKAREFLVPQGLLIFDLENILGLDYFFYLLYSRLFRKPERPPLRELVQSVKCLILSKPYQVTYGWQVDSRTVRIPLVYRSLRMVKALLEERGFRIIRLDGANIFSTVLPQVALSSTYSEARSKRKAGVSLRLLNGLDVRLGRVVHGIAGIQFVVARKT